MWQAPEQERAAWRGVRAMLAAVVFAMGACVTPLAAQISPGPLARAHAELEGSLSCTKCHGTGKGAMTQTCLSCHREIQWLVERGRGLHSRDGKAACASCHPDHAGTDFDLVKWPEGGRERFDHRRAGWALVGKHAETKCSACHKTEYRVSPSAALSPRKHGAGWVGLEQSCASCHEDVHRKSLGSNCARCHDLNAWTSAPKFDHDSSSYKLTGKHTDVKCAKCHQAARLSPPVDAKGALLSVFKPVSHKDCVDCHTDPHRGRLAGACSKCHTTSSFLTIDKRDFDHDATRYPLKGKHASVACATCHVGFPAQGMHPAFATCASCHADPHAGKATLAGRVVGCDGCHTLDGFKPSTFTVSMHARSAYPLEGRHATVSCSACHTAAPNAAKAAGGVKKVIDLRPSHVACTSCHADDHGGQLASRADKGACESCHRVSGWESSTFAGAAHAKLRLPLEGRHAQIACGACHATSRRGLPPIAATTTLGKAHVLFKLTEVECASCHVDPHQGRFARNGARPSDAGCASCHDVSHFRPSTFDVAAHAKSAFPLDGAHRAVPCIACHAEMKQALRRSSLLLAGAGGGVMSFVAKHETCASCHTNPHGDQFAKRREKGACESCHTVDAFAPASRFDHDRETAFPLKGAHAKVACTQCHKPAPGAPRSALVYGGLSSKCESCHAQPVRQ
ncbi:MAG: cytochrome c3 family protein [Gemmatimonadaceae bacterium]